MRYVLALALLLAACSGGERPSLGAASSSTVTTPAEVPPELRRFLERAEAGASQAFTAEYSVLRKLGSTTSTALVESDPPALRVSVGDVVVDAGPGAQEELLAPFGLFTGFATTGPVEALRNLAARPDAGAPHFTERTAAGVALDCVAVPVQQALTATWCITPEGVFGYVDNPSLRFELTRYEPR